MIAAVKMRMICFQKDTHIKMNKYTYRDTYMHSYSKNIRLKPPQVVSPLWGSSGSNLKTTLKVKIYDTEL